MRPFCALKRLAEHRLDAQLLVDWQFGKNIERQKESFFYTAPTHLE
jgi:hypothetical protein